MDQPRKRSATRLSYEAIAAAFAINQPAHLSFSNRYEQWRRDVLAIADVLGASSTKFNRKRFLVAAGAL